MMVYSKAGAGRQIASLHDSYIFHMLRLRPIEIRSSLSPPTMSVQVVDCCARADAIWHRARLPDFSIPTGEVCSCSAMMFDFQSLGPVVT